MHRNFKAMSFTPSSKSFYGTCNRWIGHNEFSYKRQLFLVRKKNLGEMESPKSSRKTSTRSRHQSGKAFHPCTLALDSFREFSSIFPHNHLRRKHYTPCNFYKQQQNQKPYSSSRITCSHQLAAFGVTQISSSPSVCLALWFNDEPRILLSLLFNEWTFVKSNRFTS